MIRPTGSVQYADWQDYADDLEAELGEVRAQLRGAVMERNALRQELDSLRNKYAALETDNDKAHELAAHYREQMMLLEPKGSA